MISDFIMDEESRSSSSSGIEMASPSVEETGPLRVHRPRGKSKIRYMAHVRFF